MAAFLFKTEPSKYSWDDLAREKRSVWDGITNPLALIHLRTVRKGDRIVIYHTEEERRAVGLALAASDPYADPKLSEPKRAVVDIRAERALARPIPLAELKADPVISKSDLVRIPRLSIVPLSATQLDAVLAMAGR